VWHTFYPFVEAPALRESIASYISSLFPLQDLTNEPDPFGLNLRDGLLTVITFAIRILYGSTINKVSSVDALRVCLSLMVATASISEDTLQTQCEITAQIIEELSQKLPKSFFEFLRVKVSYQNSEAVSAINMLKCLGILWILRSEQDEHRVQ
jgi:hypothetical protein